MADSPKEAEAAQREAITGTPANEGQSAQIVETVGYEAAQRTTVKGEAAKGAAAENPHPLAPKLTA